jgi:hypothetical protein
LELIHECNFAPQNIALRFMITKPKIVPTHNKRKSHFDILTFFETKWLICMGTQITKIDDERIGLNLQNTKQRNEDKNTKAKAKNTRCARPKSKQIFIVIK